MRLFLRPFAPARTLYGWPRRGDLRVCRFRLPVRQPRLVPPTPFGDGRRFMKSIGVATMNHKSQLARDLRSLDSGKLVFREDIYDLVQEDKVYGRSTVVHEMSHIVLKHSATLCRGAPYGRHNYCEDSEWQAKSLTAALMMPISACKQVQSAKELAWLCGTSIDSATYRLDRLFRSGIINQKNFSNEHA